MRRVLVIINILVFVILVFIGCASTSYLVDDVLPFEYFQGLRKGNERLVSFAPVLAPNHSDSFLYIITNPEDIQKAQDSLNNINNASIYELNKILNEFSPVAMRSTIEAQYGNGLAIFSIPENLTNFFYVYVKFNKNQKFNFNLKTDFIYGIIPYPIGSDYIFIGFSESNNDLDIYATTSYSESKSIYDNTKGLYGVYVSKKKKQIGFNEVNFNVRFQYLQGQSYKDAFSHSEVVNKYQKTTSSAIRGMGQFSSGVSGPGGSGAVTEASMGELTIYYYVYEVTVTRNWYKRTHYNKDQVVRTEMVYKDVESEVLINHYTRKQ